MSGSRWLVFYMCATCAWGEQSVPSQASIFRAGPIYSEAFPKVDIVLEVTPQVDSGANLVLRTSDLTLIEDGTRTHNATAVKPFDQTGRGVAVMLSLDASGSMRGKPMDAVRQGLGEFVNKARDYDRISVQSFADEPRLEAPWSASRSEVQRKIEGLRPRGQYTRLWDALDTSLTQFERADLPVRRHLVVISDGHDEGSTKTLAQVIEHAVRLRIPIDTIGITRSNPVFLRNLLSLSQSTQGLYTQAPDTEALKRYVATGIQRLLESPVASFTASRIRADGRTHRLGVNWKIGNQSDQVSIVVSRRTPEWLPAWVEWWHVVIVCAALVLLFGLAIRKRGARSAAVQMPSDPQSAAHPAINSSPLGAVGEKKEQGPTSPEPARASSEAAAPVRGRTQVAAAFDAPAEGKATATLLGIDGPGKGQKISIDRPEFWIGSAPNNSFCVDFDPGVSGNHLCIRFEGTSLKLYDNRSRNNTWVNQRAVGDTARLLNPGDFIQFGQSVYKLERSASFPGDALRGK